MNNPFSEQITSKELIVPIHKTVFRRKESAGFLHYVKEGGVKLVRNTLEGKEVITHIAKKGEFFSEAALFETNYHCDAIAIEHSVIVRYPNEEVLRFFKENPEKAFEYIRFLSGQIRVLRKQLEVVNVVTAKDRILLFLHSEAKNGVVKISGAVKNLAGQIGLAQETVYRQLSALEQEGVIKKEGDEIKIL